MMNTTMTEALPRMTESDAVAIALHGSTFERLRVGYAALRKLMIDPEDTKQTFILAAVLDRNHISKPFLRFMMDATGFELMHDQPTIDSSTLDFDALLQALPPGTLGHEYARHMIRHQLDPDIFQAAPGAPAAIAYLAKRLRQTHDIWHVLTGYGTDIPGEVLLQAFVYGQFGTPAPGLTALFGTLRCTFVDNPLFAFKVFRAYQRGKRASFLLSVRWEDLWSEPVDSLRVRLGLTPATAREVVVEKYQVDDQSLLLGFYRRILWDRLTERIPRAIHPNAITITSQLFAILSAASSFFAITRSTPIFHAVSSLCLMTCLTLDNLDGAHARRTKQCSRLGEFLDHGLDGLTSAAVLLSTCFVLRLNGPMTVTLCTLGALAFAGVFWEQFRTGILRLPKVSPTEGVTVLAAWQLVAALTNDAPWLRFSFNHITAGTIAVALFILAHIAAVVTPIVRSAKLGIRAWEVAPLLPMMLLQVLFAWREGAFAIVPAITVGLIAADVTSRMLMLRNQNLLRQPILSKTLYIATALPFVVDLAVPHATAWAASLSLAIVALHYVSTLWRHSRHLFRPTQ